jgi:hypothetical protein
MKLFTGMKDLNLTIEHFGEQINMGMLTAILLAALAPQRMKEFCISKVEKEHRCFIPATCHPRYYRRPT